LHKQYKFNPKVDLVENLGNEKIVYIKMDHYEISAKIPSNHTIENTVGFNSKDIFVFDENGKRIKS
jgi:ABC-type sugar transport system ATPase subunit